MKKHYKIIACATIIALLFSGIPGSSFITWADTEIATKQSKLETTNSYYLSMLTENNIKDMEGQAVTVKPRVVVNGKVNQVNGYLYNGEYYFNSKYITQLLKDSGKPFSTSMIDNKSVTASVGTLNGYYYYSLHDIAKSMNFSYTNDTVLGAVYIWTDLWYDEDAQIVEGELTRAKERGFIPASMQDNLDSQITFKEYCSILRSVISSYDPTLLTQWDSIAAKAASSNTLMTRGDGMLAVLETAVLLRLNSFNTTWWSYNEKIGNKCWDELSNRNRTLFTNMSDKNAVTDFPDFTYDAASYFYSFGRRSVVTQELLFDYDETENTMHPDKPLTRKDAVKAAIRLSESRDSEKMVALSNIGTYDKTIIPDELLSHAKDMPEPTAKAIPYYTGFGITTKLQYEANPGMSENTLKSSNLRQWSEKELRMTSEWGFNYLRVTEDYLYLFDKNATAADKNEFQKLDYLISWALKYRVHIDFQLSDYPGSANNGDMSSIDQDLDYFNNPIKQERTKQIWAIIVNRYKGIPNNVLTFSMNHEIMNPTRSSAAAPAVFTQEDVYNTSMDLINSIRSIDPDRLLFFESAFLGDKTPIATDYMKDAKVVQTFKNFGTNSFAYWNFKGIDGYDEGGFIPNWPLVQYDLSPGICRQQDSNGVQTPSLSFNGALHQGTQFNISMEQVGGAGNFVVKVDGNEIYNRNIGEGTQTISFTVAYDTQRLDIYFDGWLVWKRFNIKQPDMYKVKKRYRSASAGSVLSKTSEVETSEISLKPEYSQTMKWNYPYMVTLKDDISYITDGKKNEIGKDTLINAAQSWVQQCNEYGIAGLCNEITLYGVVDSPGLLQYIDDVTSVFKQFGIGWVDADLDIFSGLRYSPRYGITSVWYNGYQLDVEMLKAWQKNQGNAVVLFEPVKQVTFNTNGGSDIMPVSEYEGNTIGAPGNPIKTGYIFAGWYKEAECINGWNFAADKVTSNITLYAKWIPAAALKVNVKTSGNGTFTGLSVSYNYGDTVTLTAVPDKGYVLLSWTDKQGKVLSTNQSYSFSITDNVELDVNFTDICDANRDGKVSVLDLADIAKNYNKTSTGTGWKEQYDSNGDGIIDLFDLVCCSKKIN